MQIAQTGIAGAEIVERDADAEPPDLFDEIARRGLVVEQGRLGHLDLEPGSGERGQGQRVAHLLDDIAVAEILGREIDRNSRGFRPFGAFQTGGLQHEGADIGDDAHFLGERNEDGRRDRPEVGVVPSAKRLAACYAHGLHRHDGLVDHAQRLGFDGAAQVRLHELAVAEGGVHRRLEQAPSVLAEFLGLVERQIRLDDHLVDTGPVDLRNDRAGARLDAQVVAGDIDLALQAGKYLVHCHRELALVLDAVEEQHEFVAAEAADMNAVLGEDRQPFGDRIKQAVADGMAQRVVHALEIVQVDDGDRAQAVAIPSGHRLQDSLVEIGAVDQARQAVIARHGADLLFRLDARRHVLESDDAKFLIAFAGRELIVLAVGERDEDLAIAALPERAGELRLDIAAVLRRQHAAGDAAQQQGVDGTAKQRVRTVKRHQPGGLGIGDHHLAFRPQHDQPVRHGVQRAVEPVGKLACLLVADDRREQHVADVVGAVDGDERHRNDHQAERDGGQVHAQQQRQRRRADEGDREDADHDGRAVVAADHRHQRRQRQRHGGEFRERIGIDIDGQEAQRSQAQSLQAALEDIAALPLPRLLDAGDRSAQPVEGADAEIAEEADGKEDEGQGQEQRIVRPQIDHQAEDPVAGAADNQHLGVVEQRPHKLDINIRRDVFDLRFAHFGGPMLRLVMTYGP